MAKLYSLPPQSPGFSESNSHTHQNKPEKPTTISSYAPSVETCLTTRLVKLFCGNKEKAKPHLNRNVFVHLPVFSSFWSVGDFCLGAAWGILGCPSSFSQLTM